MNLKSMIVSIALAASSLTPSAWAADDANVAIAQGSKQWAAGQLDSARKSLEQAVATYPKSIDARMKLGGLLLSTGKYAEAIEAYQRVISLDSHIARAWMGLGIAYIHGGNKELSRAAFGEAVRIDPSRKMQLARLLEAPTE